MTCPRHPLAVAHAGHCAACLIEGAFVGPGDAPATVGRDLTIQLPLGESRESAVFLARERGAGGRLLRLKTWHRPAPAGFLAAFQHLQARLRASSADGIDVPEIATVDATGRAFVLGEFRRGIPLVTQVLSGRLDVSRAVALLRGLLVPIEQAHAAGLVHGAIGPGNVISDGRRACLLDFGLTALVCGTGDAALPAGRDLERFAALERMLADAGCATTRPPTVTSRPVS